MEVVFARRADMWNRWKAGQSLNEIGRALGKDPVVIQLLLARCGKRNPEDGSCADTEHKTLRENVTGRRLKAHCSTARTSSGAPTTSRTAWSSRICTTRQALPVIVLSYLPVVSQTVKPRDYA